MTLLPYVTSTLTSVGTTTSVTGPNPCDKNVGAPVTRSGTSSTSVIAAHKTSVKSNEQTCVLVCTDPDGSAYLVDLSTLRPIVQRLSAPPFRSALLPLVLRCRR